MPETPKYLQQRYCTSATCAEASAPEGSRQGSGKQTVRPQGSNILNGKGAIVVKKGRVHISQQPYSIRGNYDRRKISPSVRLPVRESGAATWSKCTREC